MRAYQHSLCERVSACQSDVVGVAAPRPTSHGIIWRHVYKCVASCTYLIIIQARASDNMPISLYPDMKCVFKTATQLLSIFRAKVTICRLNYQETINIET